MTYQKIVNRIDFIGTTGEISLLNGILRIFGDTILIMLTLCAVNVSFC
jgi:hypothetical protein